MRTWQLQEAKARLSEVVRLCIHKGPQILTIRGKEEAIIISKNEYERLVQSKPNFFDFIRQSPLNSVELVFERDKSRNREVEL